MRGFEPGSSKRGAIPYLNIAVVVRTELIAALMNLPRGACAEVNRNNVRVLRVFLQECHLNLNLMIEDARAEDRQINNFKRLFIIRQLINMLM